MADRQEVRLHGEQIGWIARGARREHIEFEWIDGYTPGPVTLTESFGSVRPKAPSAAASNFFGGYALEGRQRERLTQRRGISNPADLYAMLREFGSSIAGAVTISDPGIQSRTQPRYEPISDNQIIQRLRRAANDGDLGSDDQSRSMLAGYQPKLYGQDASGDTVGPGNPFPAPVPAATHRHSPLPPVPSGLLIPPGHPDSSPDLGVAGPPPGSLTDAMGLPGHQHEGNAQPAPPGPGRRPGPAPERSLSTAPSPGDWMRMSTPQQLKRS